MTSTFCRPRIAFLAVLLAICATASEQDARIQKIAGTVLEIPMGEKEPPLRLSLAQLMKAEPLG